MALAFYCESLNQRAWWSLSTRVALAVHGARGRTASILFEPDFRTGRVRFSWSIERLRELPPAPALPEPPALPECPGLPHACALVDAELEDLWDALTHGSLSALTV